MGCHLVLHFFGLSDAYRPAQLEEIYFLMRRVGFTYESLRSMPVSYRHWFIKHVQDELKAASPKDQYGLDDDTPISSIR